MSNSRKAKVATRRMTVGCRRPRGHESGFTLIELLVVVSIIALLVSILLPSLNRARLQAKKVACASNIRQQYIGVVMYTDAFDEWLPPTSEDLQYQVYAGFATRHFRAVRANNKLEWWNMGFIWSTGVYDTGEIFYCPSQRNETFQYESYASPTFPSMYLNAVRVAYHFNPEAEVDPGTKAYMHKYRKIAQVAPRAVMFLDLLRSDAMAHAELGGLNVGYGDGGARFVADETIVADVVNKPGNFEFEANWSDRYMWDDIMEQLSRY